MSEDSPVRLSVGSPTSLEGAEITEHGREKVPESQQTTHVMQRSVKQHPQAEEPPLHPPADSLVHSLINHLSRTAYQVDLVKTAQDEIHVMISHAQIARNIIASHYRRVETAGGVQLEQGQTLSCKVADEIERTLAQVLDLIKVFVESSEFRRWLGDLLEECRDLVEDG